MCKYCEFNKLNDNIMLDTDSVEVTVCGGQIVIAEHVLYAMITNNGGTQDTSMQIGYYMDDVEPVARIDLAIKYCPFCGRKLND